MATIGQQLLQPEAGWKRYDDTHPFIKYNGTWTRDNAIGTYNGTRIYNIPFTDQTVKFLFEGKKIRIIASVANNRSSNITMKIDGVEIGTFTQYRTTTVYQILNCDYEFDDYGIHTVEILPNGIIEIDAIDIDEDGELVRYDYLDNIDTHELLRKYGIAHFEFDESSGNVLDKLPTGNVGSMIGTTRSDGWDGNGHSLNFNGSNNYVGFTNTTIPNGNFSIRFKVKTDYNSTVNTDYRRMFATGSGTNASRGFFCDVMGDGRIRFFYWTPSVIHGIVWSDPINDNKWHDILINFNGKFMELYQNEEFKNRNLITTTTITQSYVLVIGTEYGLPSGQLLFKGQIDDFRVYSKALSPFSFTQKNTTIESSNNKIITLPCKQGRVKELLSMNELDLIKHGYTWREIDNAVDKEGIKLTQSTTEYEIVGKNNSSLGNGKVFTLPIENFKTVKVENNY